MLTGVPTRPEKAPRKRRDAQAPAARRGAVALEVVDPSGAGSKADRGEKSRAERISFGQFRLFESVGRLQNVRRCAEERHLSQSAVTQALTKLEYEADCALLDRQPDGTYLTPFGQILHARVVRWLEKTEEALFDLGFSRRHIGSLAARLSRSQVRYLIAAIESGSLAKAALDLDVTVSALQRALRSLEENLGRRLFYRTVAGIVVSQEGAELGRKLKLAGQELAMGLREIDEAQGFEARDIVLGTLPYGGSMLLASVLDKFSRQHPSTVVRIVTEGASEMMHGLRYGDVDLVVGIVHETENRDLDNLPFARTQFRVVGRKGHPLAGRTDLTLDELASYDWIVGLESSSRRLCFDKLFAARVQPRAALEISTLSIIRQLMSDSDRLTLMTSYELRHESHVLTTIPFGPLSGRPAFGITTRTDWLPTRIHRDFIDVMRRHIQEDRESFEAI